MASIEIKSFDSPDETRPFEGNGHADVLNIGGHVVGKGLFKLSQQIVGGIEPGHLMTGPSQYQSLGALSAAHIQNALSLIQDLLQLGGDELLTDDVPQLTESVDPAFFGAREAHTQIPTRPVGHVPSAAPRTGGIKG